MSAGDMAMAAARSRHTSGPGRGARSSTPVSQARPRPRPPPPPSLPPVRASASASAPTACVLSPQVLQSQLVKVWWDDLQAHRLPTDVHERQALALDRFVALLQECDRGVRPWPWWTVGANDSSKDGELLFVRHSTEFPGLKAACVAFPVAASSDGSGVRICSYDGAIVTKAQYEQLPMVVPTAVEATHLSFQKDKYVIVGRPTLPGAHANDVPLGECNARFSWSKSALTEPSLAADGSVQAPGVVDHHYCSLQAIKNLSQNEEVVLNYGRTYWDRPSSCAVCLLKEKCRPNCDNKQCFQCHLPFHKCAHSRCKGKFGFHDWCLQHYRASRPVAANASASSSAKATNSARDTILCPFHDAQHLAGDCDKMESGRQAVAAGAGNPVLTLHAGQPFGTVSLPSSQVELLDVTELSTAADILKQHGVVHVQGAVSVELIQGMALSTRRWLDEHCPQHTKTGATVELTRDAIREVETGRSIDPRGTPLDGLVDRLLADPQLRQLADHVADPNATIFPEVYLRFRRPGHYTQSHSDHNFFASRSLLADEPVCTVWIPLQPCDPATGALLLLPETRSLKQSDDRLIPKGLDLTRWKQSGSKSGYSVASATLALGSALVFLPSVVHGGPTCDDSSRAPRCSIDVRFLARSVSDVIPSSTAAPTVARIDLIVDVVGRMATYCLEWISTRTVPDAALGDLLNNVYLFQLFLNGFPDVSRVRVQLESLIAAARAPLLAGFNRLDAQQRNQYRLIWSDLTGSSVCSGPPNVPSSDIRKDEPVLQKMCAALRANPAGVPNCSSPQTPWTDKLREWSMTICHQAINDKRGDSDVVRSHCDQLRALWASLLHGGSLTGILLLSTHSITGWPWTKFAVELLYLATHCIFAQTLYQSKPQETFRIVDYSTIARLLAQPDVLRWLKNRKDAELLTEIVAVRTQ